MLVLSFGTLTSAKTLHGFVYNRDMELWMRVSDSNSFLVSDFYSSIPGMPSESKQGLLSKMERIVRSGASTESAKQMYIRLVDSEKQTSQKIVTRAHCEDRLACAIALGSASEFQTWLSSYARCLSSTGDAGALRFLVDVLLGSSDDSQLTHSCWWLNSISDQLLGLDNKDVIRCNILPEMSKNRELQRLMNEISMELDS
jgi:protein HIRA/HIR1